MIIFPFEPNQKKCIRYHRPLFGSFRMSCQLCRLAKESRAILYLYHDGEINEVYSLMKMIRTMEVQDKPTTSILLLVRGENAEELLAEIYEYLLGFESQLEEEKKKNGNHVGHPEWIDEPEDIGYQLPADFPPLFQDERSLHLSVLDGRKRNVIERALSYVINGRVYKKCLQKLTKEMSTCPKTATVSKTVLLYREFDIFVKAAMLPNDKYRKAAFVRVSNRIGGKELVSALQINYFLRPGEYEFTRIFRRETDSSYPQFNTEPSNLELREGDTIFLQRKITLQEKAKAHQAYINSHFNEEELNRTTKVNVEFLNRELFANRFNIRAPKEKREFVIQVDAVGSMKKDDVFKLVQQAGYDAREYSWPQVTIPFEDGETKVDAIVCELEESTPLMWLQRSD